MDRFFNLTVHLKDSMREAVGFRDAAMRLPVVAECAGFVGEFAALAPGQDASHRSKTVGSRQNIIYIRKTILPPTKFQLMLEWCF